jgi:hypothetical protein
MESSFQDYRVALVSKTNCGCLDAIVVSDVVEAKLGSITRGPDSQRRRANGGDRINASSPHSTRVSF